MAGFSYVSVDRLLLFDVLLLVVFHGIHGVQRLNCSFVVFVSNLILSNLIYLI